MSDCQDLTTALARELTQGIEGEVEDLGAVFKRMALLKPVEDIIPAEAMVVNEIIEDSNIADDINIDGAVKIASPNPPKPSTPSSGLMSLLHKPKPKMAQRKKPDSMLENQISLFDLMESSA